MNVLLLGPTDSPLTSIIQERGDKVVVWEAPVGIDVIRANAAEFAVSYRYRHIASKQVIEYLGGGVINLHIFIATLESGGGSQFVEFS